MTASRNASAEKLLLLGLLVPIAGGKWGSYIGLPTKGVFLSDVLVGAGALAWLTSLVGVHTRSTLTRWQIWTLTTGAIFIALEFSRGYGPTILRLRDLSPFIYICLFPATTTALKSLTLQSTLDYLDRALSFHALWSIPALMGLLPSVGLPKTVFGFPIFAIRPDIDVPLLVIFLALTVRRSRWPQPTRLLITIITSAACAIQPSRAAVVGAALGALIIVVTTRRAMPRRSANFALAGIILIAVSLMPLVSTIPISAASGVLGRAGIIKSATAAAAGGRGTQHARIQAWKLELRYYHDKGSPALGLGPGADIVRSSGALQFLSGDPSVRSPHNWWLSAWTRFGPVGLVLWIALLLAAMDLPAQTVKSDIDRIARGTGLGLMASILIAASVGVVIEAPFGAQALLLGAGLFAASRAGTAAVATPQSRRMSDAAQIATDKAASHATGVLR